MGWKLFSRDPSPRSIRKFIRALYQGALGVNPTEPDLQRWGEAVRNGTPLAEVVQNFVAQAERLRPKKASSLFFPPGHFYSPVVDPKEGAEALRRATGNGLPASLPGIALDREAMVATWMSLVPLFETSGITAAPVKGFRYNYDNGNYGFSDGSVLSAMIRKFRPAKIVEIGSGWSSACMVDTLARNPDLACDLTFIEPYPKLLEERLGRTYANYRVFAEPVQNIDPELFAALDAGDILFIDSTHVMKTGSDVCFEMFEILPRVKSGVLVHVHDMFWPFEYPEHWIVDENRSWNELYAYRLLLTHARDWEIVMFNSYMGRLERDRVAAVNPLFAQNPGGALWLRKR